MTDQEDLMRLYWKGAWLGYAVLAGLVVTSAGFAADSNPMLVMGGICFWASFPFWILRAFLRSAGRALGTRREN